MCIKLLTANKMKNEIIKYLKHKKAKVHTISKT